MWDFQRAPVMKPRGLNTKLIKRIKNLQNTNFNKVF